MKTFEIQETSLKKNQKLIRFLYERVLKNDATFHFLYEPKLIIRISDSVSMLYVKELLKKKKVDYKVYDYPFPKGKKQFGEDEKGIVYKYLRQFLPIFHAVSVMLLEADPEDQADIFERIFHTGINMTGKEWDEEALLYTWLAYGRLKLAIKHK